MLKRSKTRQGTTRSRDTRRSRSTTDSALSGLGISPSPGSHGALTRSLGTRNLTPNRPDARRARADARADINPYSPPQVSKPAVLKRQNVKRNLHLAEGKPKRDFATGRTLFPVEGEGDKPQYLPIAREATALEIQNGAFLPDEAVQKDPVKWTTGELVSVRDVGRGRTLFAMKTEDRKSEYLPRAKDATALELSLGKYVPNEAVEVPPKNGKPINKEPLRDFATGRTLFATKATNNKKDGGKKDDDKDDGKEYDYFPRESEATALELSQGRYVKDDDISAKAPLGEQHAISDRPPKYDPGKGRKVYAVKIPSSDKTKPGDETKFDTIYLPREGDASGLELAKGLFIPDDVVAAHESKRRRTALRDDVADVDQRRAQRAAKLPAGVNRKEDKSIVPVREVEDGTKTKLKLWDGFTPPEISEEKQHETLKTLKPKYDIGKGRMLYPTETVQGKVEYLPLHDDASDEEKFLGLYAAFVPPEPLEEFLGDAEAQGEIVRQSFVTKRGNVVAFKEEDIKKALERAPTLVLRSAQLVSDSARQVPELQQHF
ncbi:hypothetical protein [Leptolyngbya ohadii]|uniref:hypothetical protein n=1 Tax=Leptolyngbya ohadii TaxID=1962290 RepID=UPI0019D44AE7|nr:hypothetical protein [Leptolyngbya ohadii]